jgi:SAM-dependent methyltransferase
MDDPALAPAEHERALRGLARLNRAARVDRAVFARLADLVRARPGAALRVLELASGGGDGALALWRRARRHGIRLEWLGIDVSAFAVEHARTRAARAGAPDALAFAALDVLRDPLPQPEGGGTWDAIVACLFLHHLADDDAVQLLATAARARPRLLLVHDLARSGFGLALARAVPRLASRSRVVHHDAVASVRAAFRREELLAIAARAGLADAEVRARFPARLELCWRRP